MMRFFLAVSQTGGRLRTGFATKHQGSAVHAFAAGLDHEYNQAARTALKSEKHEYASS